MYNKLFAGAVTAILSVAAAQAQTLYMPRNIKAAYEKGTRSMTGKPGPNYWQNKGNYDITLTAHPTDRLIEGSEKIEYHNNSNDTLKSIVIRFVNNIHKPGAARAGVAGPDFLTPGLTLTKFTIGDFTYHTDAKDWSTANTVRLGKPILPHSSVELNIDWNYELSKESGREGMLDSTTMYIAYSYPRVSVFDDYNGWDRLEHSDRAEFYNDFNNYKVAVKAPKNYIVYGTGDFVNPEEVLNEPYVSKLKESYTSDEIFHIANLDELKAHKVTKQNDWNTWKFTANDISDVCFAISDHYVWDAGSVIVDPKTGRRSSMQAAYNDTTVDFPHAVEWGKYALKSFSTNWPGVPYPFVKMTAVQGQADMEFPMMVNDGTVGNNLRFAQMLQDHEMAHTYFPFYMGINETRYAYMDEGWATTFEYLIGIDEYGKGNADTTYMNFRVKRYINDPSTEEDQPIILMSSQVSGAGYGNNSYGKASLSYLALKDMLGNEKFKTALHTYMDNWNGKHPIPWDYFNSMNAGSGENLNWFFQNWFFTNNYIDLSLESVTKSKTGAVATIKNVGGFAIPFDVVVKYTNGKEERIHQTSRVWKNAETIKVNIKSSQAIASVDLDGGLFMDATPKDNLKTL